MPKLRPNRQKQTCRRVPMELETPVESKIKRKTTNIIRKIVKYHYERIKLKY